MTDERSARAMKHLSDHVNDLICAMQAAWIEWKHGKGAEAGMQWIENTLDGPDLIPDENEPYGKEAQAWIDKNRSDPMPECACGRPSHIEWMGQGFCSDEHYKQARTQ